MAVRVIKRMPLVLSMGLWLWMSLLLSLLVHPAHSHGDCNRDMSRRVRGFVHDHLLNALHIPVDSLPTTCPLHPASDLFWEQVCELLVPYVWEFELLGGENGCAKLGC